MGAAHSSAARREVWRQGAAALRPPARAALPGSGLMRHPFLPSIPAHPHQPTNDAVDHGSACVAVLGRGDHARRLVHCVRVRGWDCVCGHGIAAAAQGPLQWAQQAQQAQRPQRPRQVGAPDHRRAYLQSGHRPPTALPPGDGPLPAGCSSWPSSWQTGESQQRGSASKAGQRRVQVQVWEHAVQYGSRSSACAAAHPEQLGRTRKGQRQRLCHLGWPQLQWFPGGVPLVESHLELRVEGHTWQQEAVAWASDDAKCKAQRACNCQGTQRAQ